MLGRIWLFLPAIPQKSFPIIIKHEINVMVYFKPGEEWEWCIIPESDTGIVGKKKSESLLSGVKPKTLAPTSLL